MDKHCRSCGAELTERVGSRCPNCGAEILGADKPGKPPSGKKPGSSNRTPLLIAGAMAAVVIVVVAIVVISSSGSDDSSASPSSSLPSADELPVKTVAVVSGVRGSAQTITTADLERAISQAAAQKELKSAPIPGDPKYKEIEEAGLGEILDATWIQGQAAEMGISTTGGEVAEELANVTDEDFKTEKEYQDFLKTSLFTEADVLDRVELQLLSTKIQEQISDGAEGGKDAREEAFAEFVTAYQTRWRARTVCAEPYVIERCSNGPEPKEPSSSPAPSSTSG